MLLSARGRHFLSENFFRRYSAYFSEIVNLLLTFLYGTFLLLFVQGGSPTSPHGEFPPSNPNVVFSGFLFLPVDRMLLVGVLVWQSSGRWVGVAVCVVSLPV